MWRELRRELVVGVRQFRESRGALASLTLALALGVASNVAIVSELRDLIAPVSFPGQQHVFLVQRTDAQPPADGSASPPNPRLSIPDFNDFAQQQHVFEAIGGYDLSGLALLTGADRPRTVGRGFVTPGAFAVLGVSPVVGRSFVASDFEPSAPPVALIGRDLWRTAFNSDPLVIGRSIEVDEQQFSIIGVLPDTVRELLMPRAQLFATRADDGYLMTPFVDGMGGEFERTIRFLRTRRDFPWLTTIARVAPGVSFAAAQADVSAVGEGPR